jgi:site-specific recombinase XerC
MHVRIEGKGDKVRFIPVATEAQRLIHEDLKASEHGEDIEGPLFGPVKNNTTGELRKPLNPKSVYDEVVKHYGKEVGITGRAWVLCALAARDRGDERPRT